MSDNISYLRDIREDFCVSLRRVRSKNVIANRRKQLFKNYNNLADSCDQGQDSYISYQAIQQSIITSFEQFKMLLFEQSLVSLETLAQNLENCGKKLLYDPENIHKIINQLINFLEFLIISQNNFVSELNQVFRNSNQEILLKILLNLTSNHFMKIDSNSKQTFEYLFNVLYKYLEIIDIELIDYTLLIFGNILSDNNKSVDTQVYEYGIVHKVLYSILEFGKFDISNFNMNDEFISAITNFQCSLTNYSYITDSVEPSIQEQMFYMLGHFLQNEEFTYHIVEMVYNWKIKFENQIVLDLLINSSFMNKLFYYLEKNYDFLWDILNNSSDVPFKNQTINFMSMVLNLFNGIVIKSNGNIFSLIYINDKMSNTPEYYYEECSTLMNQATEFCKASDLNYKLLQDALIFQSNIVLFEPYKKLFVKNEYLVNLVKYCIKLDSIFCNDADIQFECMWILKNLLSGINHKLLRKKIFLYLNEQSVFSELPHIDCCNFTKISQKTIYLELLQQICILGEEVDNKIFNNNQIEDILSNVTTMEYEQLVNEEDFNSFNDFRNAKEFLSNKLQSFQWKQF